VFRRKRSPPPARKVRKDHSHGHRGDRGINGRRGNPGKRIDFVGQRSTKKRPTNTKFGEGELCQKRQLKINLIPDSGVTESRGISRRGKREVRRDGFLPGREATGVEEPHMAEGLG